MRKKTSPLKIIALLLVFTFSFFTGKFIADWGLIGRHSQGDGEPKVTQEGDTLPVNRLNVLLMGIDARKGEKDTRTDSMILVSIDRETKKIAMVSIPRDTMVELPGHGRSKINSANALGGAELARETVEDLLGLKIPYYVKTNFEGFKDIVDTLGGVDIAVDKRMYYPAENINLKPGLQRLDGYNALGYVRFRSDVLGDIARAERQQIFLTALAKEMLRARTIIKLPKLIPQLMAAVDTNLGAGDAIFLTRAASNLKSTNIVTATLPGTFYNYKGASYWKADEDKAKTVLNELFEGMRVATITGPDITIPVNKPVVKPKEPPAPPQEPAPQEPVQEPEDTGEEDAETDDPNIITEPGDTEQDPTTTPQTPVDGQAPAPVDETQPTSPTTPAPGSTTPGSGSDTGSATQTETPGANVVTTPKVDIITQG